MSSQGDDNVDRHYNSVIDSENLDILNNNSNMKGCKPVQSNISILKPQDIWWCKVVSGLQMLGLLLLTASYSALLVYEPKTYGWIGVLKIYGISVVVKDPCAPVSKLLPITSNEISDEFSCQNGISKESEYSFFPSFGFLYHIFVLSGAMSFLSIFCCGESITSLRRFKLATSSLLFYFVVSIYFLCPLVNNFLEARNQISIEMNAELSQDNVKADHISHWWTETQSMSECCGGLNGYRDWKMKPEGRYHSSCFNNSVLIPRPKSDISYHPTETEVWQVGCIKKEKSKITRYGLMLLSLLLLQIMCGSILLISFIYAPTHTLLPIYARYSINCYQRKQKFLIFIQSEREGFSITHKPLEKVTIIMQNISENAVLDEVRNYPVLGGRIKLGHLNKARYVLKVSENCQTIGEVEICGHKSVIEQLKLIRLAEFNSLMIKC